MERYTKLEFDSHSHENVWGRLTKTARIHTNYRHNAPTAMSVANEMSAVPDERETAFDLADVVVAAGTEEEDVVEASTEVAEAVLGVDDEVELTTTPALAGRG